MFIVRYEKKEKGKQQQNNDNVQFVYKYKLIHSI